MKHVMIGLLGLCFFASSFAEEEAAPAQDNKQNVAKLSEAFGHLIGKNIASMTSKGLELDMLAVIKGLQSAAEGKTSPMTEMECIQAITEAQENALKDQSANNLSLAEEFLKKNGSVEGIVSLEGGKVQYKIEREGSGDKLEENSSPLIRYVGKFLDGTVFGSSEEDEMISLEEMIPGLKSGMTGMAEGEKRIIYIHPNCAYGTSGGLPPNSLLTFEIEVIKAQAPVQDSAISSNNTEIALPDSSDQLR